MKTLFSYIRRQKSLFLFGAVVAVTALYMWGIRPGVERKRQDVVAISNASGSKVEWDFHLGEVEYIPGVDAEMLKLTATKTKPGFVYGSYEEDKRNILFLAGDKESARWLFPNQNNVIHSVVQLSEQVNGQSSPAKEKLVKALYFVYSDKDPGGDGGNARHAPVTLGLSKPNGEGFVAVLKDIDRLYHVWMKGDKTISILYRTGRSLRHARYSVATLTRESDQEVAAIPGIEYRN